MENNKLTRFEDLITVRLKEIDVEDQNTRQDRATVVLDQQSVGRLSRMDAMQQQAMANATHQRRLQEKSRLQAALQRITAGEFGYCADCGGDIPDARLDLNPAVQLCIGCARG